MIEISNFILYAPQRQVPLSEVAKTLERKWGLNGVSLNLFEVDIY